MVVARATEDAPIENIRWCNIVKDCGHNCYGVKGEAKCLPCISDEHREASTIDQLRKEFSALESDLCGICLEELVEFPSVRVCQKHALHAECMR